MSILKKLFVSIVVTLITLPGIWFGLELKWGETLTITEPIENDLYAAAWQIRIDTQITGDLSVAGWEVDINNSVSEDLNVWWWKIQIKADVADDLRVVWWEIDIDSSIQGDLIVVWWDIKITSWAEIWWDLVVLWGRLYMWGTVQWDSVIKVWELTLDGLLAGDSELVYDKLNLSDGATIQQNLTYQADSKNLPLEEKTAWEAVYDQIDKDGVMGEIKEDSEDRLGWYIGYTFLCLLVFGIIFSLWKPNFINRLADQITKAPWKSFWSGLIYFAVMPFIIIILMISVIGVPFGGLALAMYLFSFILYQLLWVLAFSKRSVDKLGREGKWKHILMIGLWSLGFAIVPIVDIILGFFALGALISLKTKFLNQK